MGWRAGRRVAAAPPGIAVRDVPWRIWSILSVPATGTSGGAATATATGGTTTAAGPAAWVRRSRTTSDYTFDASFRYGTRDAFTAPTARRTSWAAAAAQHPFCGRVKLGVVSFLWCKSLVRTQQRRTLRTCRCRRAGALRLPSSVARDRRARAPSLRAWAPPICAGGGCAPDAAQPRRHTWAPLARRRHVTWHVLRASGRGGSESESVDQRSGRCAGARGTGRW